MKDWENLTSTIRIVPTTADLAWQRRNNTWQVHLAHKGNDSNRQHGRSDGEREHGGSDGEREHGGSDGEREHGGSDGGREGECSGGTQTRSEDGRTDERKRSRWSCWLKSRLYGTVVRYLLFGMEGLGYRLKRTERKWVTRLANRFVMVEASEARLFWREVDGRLAACIREEEVDRILHYLHDTHGHFAWRITAGRCYGEYY